MNRCFKGLLFAVLVAGGTALAGNLIMNGDFSQPIDSGWTVSSSGDDGTAAIAAADEPYGFVSQTMKGRVSMYQVIPVENVDAEFSFSGRFHAEVTKEGYGALAKVAVVYCDADTATLGKTLFGRAAGSSALESDKTQHSIVAKADKTWTDYRLSIAKELSKNLTGVDASKVKYLRIGLIVDNGELTGC
jgi:hypothetical protein